MPLVANYRIIRVERIELLHEALAAPVKVADFEVPPEAARHSAVLSAMISPAFSMSINADFNFALVLNGRDVFDDTIFRPRALLVHRPRDEAPSFSTSVSVALPILDPPWLKAGANRLDLRETREPAVDVGNAAGVAVSDVVLWYQQLTG
jgi:hypothetical protein